MPRLTSTLPMDACGGPLQFSKLDSIKGSVARSRSNPWVGVDRRKWISRFLSFLRLSVYGYFVRNQFNLHLGGMYGAPNRTCLTTKKTRFGGVECTTWMVLGSISVTPRDAMSIRQHLLLLQSWQFTWLSCSSSHVSPQFPFLLLAFHVSQCGFQYIFVTKPRIVVTMW